MTSPDIASGLCIGCAGISDRIRVYKIFTLPGIGMLCDNKRRQLEAKLLTAPRNDGDENKRRYDMFGRSLSAADKPGCFSPRQDLRTASFAQPLEPRTAFDGIEAHRDPRDEIEPDRVSRWKMTGSCTRDVCLRLLSGFPGWRRWEIEAQVAGHGRRLILDHEISVWEGEEYF